jgi:predicted deacylase
VANDDFYPVDYFTARERFIAASTAAGFEQQALPIEAPSPTDEPLTIDVACLRSQQPNSAIVISSGLHGVEAPFGAAVQLAFLHQLSASPAWRPRPNCGVILLHALNPFGFAWQRRFNEDNVDLNRNFLLTDQEYIGAPSLSGSFRTALTPAGLHRGFGFWPARMAYLALRHGLGSFWQTLPVGQYDYPDWLFFGGRAPSQTAEQLDRCLPALLSGVKEVVHLDFHTGLGRWAECELLLSENERPEIAAWWSRWFAESRIQPAAATESSYIVRGGFGPWLQSRFASCNYRYAVAEFGTYSPRRVIQALADEVRWHNQLTSKPSALARRRLADIFVPRDPRWRAKSLDTGLNLVRRAVESLST